MTTSAVIIAAALILGAVILAVALQRVGARNERELLVLMRADARAQRQEAAAAAAVRPRSTDVRVEPHD